MGPAADSSRAVLVVTGPVRERLAVLFRRVYFGRDDVAVVVERRQGERRQGERRQGGRRKGARRQGERRQGERRQGERRRSPPWLVFPPGPPSG